jgi:hypothetical protein
VNQKRKDDENRNNYPRDERSLRPGSKHVIREKASNEKELSHRWPGASFAAKFSVEVVGKLNIGTVSGWLHRFG